MVRRKRDRPQREAQPLAAIEAALAAEDPGRIFIPASPSDGDVHQWKLWHGFAPWTSLTEEQPPFMSEFGLQALPNLATVSQMFSGHPPRFLRDPRWRERKAQAAKLQHYANPPLEGDLGMAVAASQRAQMTALQVGMRPRGCGAASAAVWSSGSSTSPAGRHLVGDRPRWAPEVGLRDVAPQLPAAPDRGALSVAPLRAG